MKKLFSLIFVSLLIASVTILAQEKPAGPNGVPGRGPGNIPGGPPVPKAIRENSDFKQWTADFRTGRANFKARLQELRVALKNAEESDKSGIREQIRDQLKQHRAEQIAFRKRVRTLTDQVRQARADASKGAGE